jgi:hypothetical protein
MTGSLVVKLHCNSPWASGVSTHRWRNILESTAHSMHEQIVIWHNDDMLDREHDSIAAVLLSPAYRDKSASVDLSQLVMAFLLVGPQAREFAPAALSAADVHYRYEMPLQEMIENNPHLLPSGISSAAYSVEDHGVIAGGAGLPCSTHGLELLTRELEFLVQDVIAELNPVVEGEAARHDSGKAGARYVRICDEIFDPTPHPPR